MNIVKAAIVGAIGSLVMFVVMTPLIRAGIAPFNVPPSAAFLLAIGIANPPLALAVHFGYGALASIGLVALYRERTNLATGLAFAGVLWLILMIVYSPIIGWGVFGIGASGTTLMPTDPLYLKAALPYAAATLGLHLVYGLVVGALDRMWIVTPQLRKRRDSHPGTPEPAHSHQH